MAYFDCCIWRWYATVTILWKMQLADLVTVQGYNNFYFVYEPKLSGLKQCHKLQWLWWHLASTVSHPSLVSQLEKNQMYWCSIKRLALSRNILCVCKLQQLTVLSVCCMLLVSQKPWTEILYCEMKFLWVFQYGCNGLSEHTLWIWAV